MISKGVYNTRGARGDGEGESSPGEVHDGQREGWPVGRRWGGGEQKKRTESGESPGDTYSFEELWLSRESGVVAGEKPGIKGESYLIL